MEDHNPQPPAPEGLKQARRSNNRLSELIAFDIAQRTGAPDQWRRNLDDALAQNRALLQHAAAMRCQTSPE